MRWRMGEADTNSSVWLYTRWSLTTPVIREESIGPLAATRRSNQLVRGHFWFVFMTANVAYSAVQKGWPLMHDEPSALSSLVANR